MSPQREASGRWELALYAAGVALHGAMLLASAALFVVGVAKGDPPLGPFTAAMVAVIFHAGMVGLWSSKAIRLLSPVPTGEGTGA